MSLRWWRWPSFTRNWAPWYHKAKSELPGQDFGHERFLTTIGEIEELTGLSFPKLTSPEGATTSGVMACIRRTVYPALSKGRLATRDRLACD